MKTDYIILREYTQQTNLEPAFFIQLEESGLIDIQIIDGEKLFPSSQLTDLEKYARMYYDLSINMEGIDAIHNILNRMKELQSELYYLRTRLRIYESDGFEFEQDI